MAPTPTVSIVIRTKNEEKYLEAVLTKLVNQTFKNFEIIIVDDNSTDKTLKIVKKFGTKITKIPKGKFTYPVASNIGAKYSKGKFLVYLSGHSIPIKRNWLELGLKNFNDKKIAGVYGYQLALPDANLLERSLYFISSLARRKRYYSKGEPGVLGATNAIIRKDLWLKRPFNEKFAGGGEDGEWAKYWIGKGFLIVHDPNFAVYHSHNLGPIKLIIQQFRWLSSNKPTKLKPQMKNF